MLRISMIFKANTDVSQDEEFTIRYEDWMESKLSIRRELKKKWYFDCLCPRCASPTDLGTYISSPKCTKCKAGNLIPQEPLNHISDWICETCQQGLIKWENVVKIEQAAKDLIKENEHER